MPVPGEVLTASARAQELLAVYDDLPADMIDRAAWIASRMASSVWEFEPPGTIPVDLTAWARLWRAFLGELERRGNLSPAEYVLTDAMLDALTRYVRGLAS